jgi:hypothetical protein
MTNNSEHVSFATHIALRVAEAESGVAIDDGKMEELDICFSLSAVLSLSHRSTYATPGEVVTATEVIAHQRRTHEHAELCFDVIMGRKTHELVDVEKAKGLLLHHATSADMLVSLVRRAMLELERRDSD